MGRKRIKEKDKAKHKNITLPPECIEHVDKSYPLRYNKKSGFSTYIAELIKLDEKHDLINKYGKRK